jgi:ribosome recycling factor
MKADVILTEDSFKDYEKQVQDLTNKYTKKIDELAVAKEEDLMKI